MDIVFMGTPDFAAGVLESIISAGHNVKLVVTKQDKPKGRSQEMLPTPVKQMALQHGIEVFQPAKIKNQESIEYLKGYAADVFVVVAYGQILSQEILDMPRICSVNIHASLLPKYRGSAPIQWAVINGEEYSGITTMRMDAGIDTGDIIEQSLYKLKEKETGGSLFDELMHLGSKTIISTLEKLENNTAKFIKQDDSISTHAKMLTKQLGDIDFSMSAVEIERLIRGLNPWPSAYTYYNGKSVKLWEATVLDKEFSGTVGQIVELTKDTLLVKTGKGTLSITELQMEGKKRMYIEDFLRGNKLETGQLFGKLEV